MQFNGIFIDKEYLENRSLDIGKKIDALEIEIIDLAGENFNLNSSQQLAVILFDKLQLPMVKKRSTAEAVLKELGAKVTSVASSPNGVNINKMLGQPFLKTLPKQ